MLVSDMMVECHRLRKVAKPDGEGGQVVDYKPMGAFMAAIVRDSRTHAQVAEAGTPAGSYTVTTPDAVALEYGDVFQRDSDGKTFLVTSDAYDSQPPKSATFAFNQVTAILWEVPGCRLRQRSTISCSRLV